MVYVQITDKALRLLKQIDKPLEQLHRRLIGHLSSAELSKLSRLLEKARRGTAAESSQAD